MAGVVFGASRLEQIPSDILKLIFFKLDFKTARSCKLLNKAFGNLISTLILDPSFIQSLVENSPVAFMILAKDGSGSTNFRVCLDDFEEDKSPDPIHPGCHTLTTIKVNANFPVFKQGNPQILGSCNGLLLMKHVKVGFKDCFYICNPLLGEGIKVPSCTREVHTLVNEAFGLFFDPMTIRYSVLRILKFSNKNPDAEIHEVGSGTWKRIIANDLLYPRSTKRIDDVRLNKALHWVAFDDHGKLSICSFHIEDKNFKNISPPWKLRHDQRTSRTTSFELGVLWDCLCLCNVDICVDDDAPHMYIWVMWKYGDVDTWIKVFSMSRISIPNAYPYTFLCPILQPISTLKNGEILMLCWGNRVVCFNPVTNKLRGINFEEDVISAYPWVPSFISLRG